MHKSRFMQGFMRILCGKESPRSALRVPRGKGRNTASLRACAYIIRKNRRGPAASRCGRAASRRGLTERYGGCFATVFCISGATGGESPPTG